MSAARNLPLSMVTLVFGAGSLLLAFARHLVSLAVVLAVLAILFHLWGRWKAKKNSYSVASLKRSRLGFLIGIGGMICAVTMWVLWATNVLLEH